MNRTANLKPGTVSRQLRAAGFVVLYAETTRTRQGIRVTNSGPDTVAVHVDIDLARRAADLTAEVTAALADLGYAVTANPGEATILYVTRATVDADPMLTTAEVAARLNWSSTAAVRTAVRTGHLPAPDDDGDPAVAVNRRSKRWLTSTIDTYLATRPGQGARTDLVAS